MVRRDQETRGPRDQGKMLSPIVRDLVLVSRSPFWSHGPIEQYIIQKKMDPPEDESISIRVLCRYSKYTSFEPLNLPSTYISTEYVPSVNEPS